MKKDYRTIFIFVMSIIMLIVMWLIMQKGFLSKTCNTNVHNIDLTIDEENKKDNGKIVVIDPGHGGIDPGMVGVNDTIEKEINLQISYILKDKLEDKGFKVLLTRQTDDGLYDATDGNKKIADMKKRCEIIKNASADIVVSIHQNSFSEESVNGAQVFYYKHSVEGKKLAEIIQKSIKDYVDGGNTRVAKGNDSYYMLIHTPCPTVIVECGFITNYEEAKLLVTNEYQEKICDAICMAIVEFLDK